MRHYDSIPRIQDDGTLMGEMVWGYNKLDGQNFCVKYNPRTREFGPYGSRKAMVDETSEQFGDCVKWFEGSNYREILNNIVRTHRGKKDIFQSFFFQFF